MKSEEVKLLITDLEQIRNGFSGIHSEEYRDSIAETNIYFGTSEHAIELDYER